MRRLIPILIAAALASPLSADALRLVAPPGGAQLRGGSFATIAWSAGALPDGAEEWEAFLSLDGGTYYAYRITPHLSTNIRRFEFLVPNADTRQARILIRAGNERRETSYEIAATFSIERDPRAELPLSPALASRGGEAARAGDPDVIAWADGDRAATRVTQRTGGEHHAPEWQKALHAEELTFPADAPQTDEACAHDRHGNIPTAAMRRLAVYASQQPPPADLLLVCHRLNI